MVAPMAGREQFLEIGPLPLRGASASSDPSAFDRRARLWQCAAGLSGAVGVIAGALGAHVVSDAALAKLADTASYYQLIHAAALLWLASRERRGLRAARWLFLAGTVLFCGTLYLKAFGVWPAAVALAPAGGVSFIAGWVAVAVDAWLC
jgi:uncharacterized membrane protein YgdD (TMEM256/DUF423 family)